MRQWTALSLIQIINWCLFAAKPAELDKWLNVVYTDIDKRRHISRFTQNVHLTILDWYIMLGAFMFLCI